MKRLRKLMALCAIAGMTTFLTGCGDDDGGDDDNGGGVLIPTTEAQLRAQQYTLNVAGDPDARVLVFPQENRYEITTGTNTFTGAYSSPTFANNQWNVTLSPDNPSDDNPSGNLVLTFAPQGGSGTFSFTPTDGGAVEQGTFTYTALNGNTDGNTDGGNNGGPQFAPADQAGLTASTYTATTGAGSTVLAFPTANTYELTLGENPTESGSFTASRNGEEWTLNLVPSGTEPASTVVLTFTGENAGTLVYTPVEGTAQSGAFVASGTGSTDGSTDGTTDGGTGSGNAPADISGSWDMNVTSGPYVGTYVLTLGGGAFNIVRASDGNPAGEGTYTYTTPHNGNTDQAHLVMNYTGEFAGDRDDYVLTFSNPNAASFSGTVSSGGQGGEAAGGTLARR